MNLLGSLQTVAPGEPHSLCLLKFRFDPVSPDPQHALMGSSIWYFFGFVKIVRVYSCGTAHFIEVFQWTQGDAHREAPHRLHTLRSLQTVRTEISESHWRETGDPTERV